MTHKKNKHFFQIGITSFLVCSCLFIGCAAPEKRLTKDQLTISYPPQFSLDREVKKLRLEHPIKISAGQMANHLLSLRYKQLNFSGKKKYIFSPNDVLEITPTMTKALNRLKSSKVLYYEIETPRGKTAGIIFRAEEKINWRFEAINGTYFENKGLHNGGAPWMLFPNNGQKFHQERTVLGNNWKGNWIISNLELPLKSKRGRKLGLLKKTSESFTRKRSTQKETLTKARSSGKGEFEKRLQFLKELRDKRLINDDEYRNKKEELLGQFP